MSYIGIGMNNSPTRAAIAKEEITDARGKCVKFDESGDYVVTTAQTDVPAGIITSEGPDTIEQGMTYTVQIKDIGLAKAGEAISAGDLVAGDADGVIKKATSGYAIGQAMEKAEEGQFFYVQIFKTTVGGGGGGGGSSVSFPITVAQGGTGATDAETARTNLEVDSKTNTDATKATAEAAKATAEQNKTDIQSLTERVTTLEG